MSKFIVIVCEYIYHFLFILLSLFSEYSQTFCSHTLTNIIKFYTVISYAFIQHCFVYYSCNFMHYTQLQIYYLSEFNSVDILNYTRKIYDIKNSMMSNKENIDEKSLCFSYKPISEPSNSILSIRYLNFQD